MKSDRREASGWSEFSGQGLLSILRSLPIGLVLLKEPEYDVVYLNERFREYLSFPVGIPVPQSADQFFSFDPDVQRKMDLTRKAGGKATFTPVSLYPSRNAGTGLMGTLTLQRITDEGKEYTVLTFEPELPVHEKINEERLQIALHGADLGTWDLDPVRRIVSWDDRCRELYGFPDDARVSYDEVIKSTHPADQAKVQKAVEEALDPGNTRPYEVEFRTIGLKNQTLRWLRCRGKAFFNDQGVAYRFSGTAQDITEEMNLKITQQKLLSLVEASTDLLAVFSTDFSLVYMNDSGKSMLGIEGDYTTLKLRDFYSDAYEPIVQEEYRSELLESKSWSGQFNLRHFQTQEEIPVQLYAILITDPVTGEITGRGYQARDLRRDIQLKQEIEESKTRFRNLIMEAPIPTAVLLGESLRLDIVNDAALRLWGKGPEVLGLPIEEVLPELKGTSQLTGLQEDFRTGMATHGKEIVAFLPAQGERKSMYIHFIYKLLHDATGEVIGILITGYDVTTQVEAHKRIKDSEIRLEKLVAERTRDLSKANKELQQTNDSLQQFAYAASHDLQEPLRKLQSFSSLLISRYSQSLPPDGLSLLARMQMAAERMSGLVKDLLMFSRLTSEEISYVEVDLNRVIREVVSDLEMVIEEQKAEIQVSELPLIKGNERQLTQLLQNLMSNAIKFHKAGEPPRIYVQASQVPAAELPAELEHFNERTYVCLEIRDEGIGFDERYLDRIFQMFQRLHDRQDFAGTGVGLALCKKVVENHQGFITARSFPGKGTRFLIYLHK